MINEVTILKIGGSVITHKNNIKIKENKKEIDRIAKEIKKYSGNKKLILVHGAGSFGHNIIKKYHSNIQTFMAFSEIHDSVQKLNRRFINSLRKNNLNAIGFDPFSMCFMNNNNIESMNLDPIISALNKDIIPILYGDICFNKKNEIEILSGDKITIYLGNKFKSHRIGFGCNTNGVLDNQQNTIKLITNNNISKYNDVISYSKGIDFTGGMKGKINEIISFLKNKNTQTFIFNATEENSIISFLNGDYIGTMVCNDTLNI